MRPSQLRKLTVPEGGNLDVLATTHVKSMFASGLRNPRGLIFDRAGKLFVAQIPPSASGDILKFIRRGGPTVFASDWRSGRKWWPAVPGDPAVRRCSDIEQ